jgi:hypothetical protein
MKRSQIIQHQGKNIFYMNFSGLRTEEEIKHVISESKLFIRSQISQSVYGLANIENMHFNNEIKELFSDFVKGNKEYMVASAVLGVSGLKQIVFNGLMKMTGREVKSFNNINVAKDWLVARN